MTHPRLKQLLEFLLEEPNDAFTLYAIAMEYMHTDPEKSMDFFNRLLTFHETYTATYYQAGKLYEQLGLEEEAKKIYMKGIDICMKAGKMKTVAELRSAYEMLED